MMMVNEEEEGVNKESEDDEDGGGGGVKVLTWLSVERRGMERVRPCPSTG